MESEPEDYSVPEDEEILTYSGYREWEWDWDHRDAGDFDPDEDEEFTD